MDLSGKLEAEVEIASSGDLFHEMWSNAPHEICNLETEILQSCDAHEGEFGKPGSILSWNFTVEGKSYAIKERVESIDDENKILKLVVIEGDLLEEYKSFEVTLQVLPKGDGMNVVKWTIDYEKLHEEVADPHKILEATIEVTKKIEEHHSQA